MLGAQFYIPSRLYTIQTTHITSIVLYTFSVLSLKLTSAVARPPLYRLKAVMALLTPGLFCTGAALLSLIFFASLVRARYRQNLKSIPGPFLASVTDLWRLLNVNHGRFELTLRALHQQNGPLVRIGPKCISVADPKEIKTIYGFARPFPKVR